jgi:pyrroline-5-carboxylate reductase
MTAELLVVGGGRMGEALIGGLLAAGRSAADIVVVEPVPDRAEELRQSLGVEVVDEPVAARGVVVAVKPDVVPTVAFGIGQAGADRVLSIAAGVSLAAIEAALDLEVPVVRAMPNTPALVGMGVAAIAPGTYAGEGDMAWAEEVLGAVGTVVRLSERHLDAVTGLSGSGPAYVFLVAEALVEAGVLQGLPRAEARHLAVGTLRGAAELLARQPDVEPARLRADVTSPGGTTAAGLAVLERRAVRAAFIDAVEAATARSRQLGG